MCRELCRKRRRCLPPLGNHRGASAQRFHNCELPVELEFVKNSAYDGCGFIRRCLGIVTDHCERLCDRRFTKLCDWLLCADTPINTACLLRLRNQPLGLGACFFQLVAYGGYILTDLLTSQVQRHKVWWQRGHGGSPCLATRYAI